jgi:F420-0:gamma-glutamyl ligase
LVNLLKVTLLVVEGEVAAGASVVTGKPGAGTTTAILSGGCRYCWMFQWKIMSSQREQTTVMSQEGTNSMTTTPMTPGDNDRCVVPNIETTSRC